MMDFYRVDPQLRSAIEQSAQGFLSGFVDLGIDTVPELVSFENAEYVSQLLAVESVIPGYERDVHDRDIVLRFHQQLCISGLLGKECTITVLRQRLDKLRQTVTQAQLDVQALTNPCSLPVLYQFVAELDQVIAGAKDELQQLCLAIDVLEGNREPITQDEWDWEVEFHGEEDRRPYEGDYPEVVALGNWERQRHEEGASWN